MISRCDCGAMSALPRCPACLVGLGPRADCSPCEQSARHDDDERLSAEHRAIALSMADQATTLSVIEISPGGHISGEMWLRTERQVHDIARIETAGEPTLPPYAHMVWVRMETPHLRPTHYFADPIPF